MISTAYDEGGQLSLGVVATMAVGLRHGTQSVATDVAPPMLACVRPKPRGNLGGMEEGS